VRGPTETLHASLTLGAYRHPWEGSGTRAQRKGSANGLRSRRPLAPIMEALQQGEIALSILPTYSPTHRVAASHAKQDQIRLEVGDWRLSAPQPFAFFSALCAPSGRDGLSFTGASLRRPTLQIRKGGRGKGERVGGPLFTGELRSRRVGAEDAFLPDTHALRLNLSLNPTRYVAHQQSRRFGGVPVAEWALPHPALYRRRPVRATRLEAILDGNDNVLLTGAAQAHGQPDAWPMHLQRYWRGVIGANSTRSWARIPRDGGHGFHGIVGAL
jgi:hypothetical protein